MNRPGIEQRSPGRLVNTAIMRVPVIILNDASYNALAYQYWRCNKKVKKLNLETFKQIRVYSRRGLNLLSI